MLKEMKNTLEFNQNMIMSLETSGGGSAMLLL